MNKREETYSKQSLRAELNRCMISMKECQELIESTPTLHEVRELKEENKELRRGLGVQVHVEFIEHYHELQKTVASLSNTLDTANENNAKLIHFIDIIKKLNRNVYEDGLKVLAKSNLNNGGLQTKSTAGQN